MNIRTLRFWEEHPRWPGHCKWCGRLHNTHRGNNCTSENDEKANT